MKSEDLIGCNKCSLIKTGDSIDAISTVSDFQCIDSRFEIFFPYVFRRY